MGGAQMNKPGFLSTEVLIEFDHVYKIYEMGDAEVRALDHVSFQIRRGEFVALVGQSGSGKSTCMNIMGALDLPTAGRYYLAGQEIGFMRAIGDWNVGIALILIVIGFSGMTLWK